MPPRFRPFEVLKAVFPEVCASRKCRPGAPAYKGDFVTGYLPPQSPERPPSEALSASCTLYRGLPASLSKTEALRRYRSAHLLTTGAVGQCFSKHRTMLSISAGFTGQSITLTGTHTGRAFPPGAVGSPGSPPASGRKSPLRASDPERAKTIGLFQPIKFRNESQNQQRP